MKVIKLENVPRCGTFLNLQRLILRLILHCFVGQACDCDLPPDIADGGPGSGAEGCWGERQSTRLCPDPDRRSPHPTRPPTGLLGKLMG